tara:strand:+ start:7384 stop:8130 length:747 start_codon:yes stop_codon:yes gene_type:complete
MKNIFITLIFLISTNSIFCQEVFYLHAVKIDDDNIENFESIQREYVSALAQDAKKDGIIKDWVLLKPIENVGEITDQEYNYVWVHIFENVEQMTNRSDWWLNSKEKFGIDPSVLYQGELEKSGYFYWKTEKQIESSTDGEYIIMNWATPKDLNKALSMADELSEGFRKSMKKEGMAEWGVATKVLPQGEGQSTIFFWDVYNSLEGAFKHMMNQAVLSDLDPNKFSEFFENMPNGWDGRGIFEFVTGTN